MQGEFNSAIVIGGGIAGMVTARVLSRYFNKVTIIERDTLSAIQSGNDRSGVPQRFSAHILWPIGLQAVMKFFPKMEEALAAAGAYPAHYPDDAHTYLGAWKPKTHRPGQKSYVLSREMLDNVIRSLIQDDPHIQFLYNTDVHMLIGDFKEKKIQGVLISDRSKNEDISLYADLVVDASGYHTVSPDWLDSLGYGKPEKEEVKIHAYLLSRFYRWPENLANWRYARIYGPCKDVGVVASQIEDDGEGKRWIVTLTTEAGGTFDLHDPEAEFNRKIQQLPNPEIYELVKQGTPLSPVYPYQFAANRRYHYETLEPIPNGFLAIGDSIMALNPRHALGMNTAVLTAELLDDAFKQQEPSDLYQIIQKYYGSAATLFDQVWPLIVNDSLKFSATEGKRPFALAFQNWYMSSINVLANNDPEVWLKLWSVIRLEKPRSILYQPSILIRVLLQAIKR